MPVGAEQWQAERNCAVHDWENFEEAKRIALIFGPGGLYTAPDLRARSAMIETLAATIRLIHDELELFSEKSAQDLDVVVIPEKRGTKRLLSAGANLSEL